MEFREQRCRRLLSVLVSALADGKLDARQFEVSRGSTLSIANGEPTRLFFVMDGLIAILAHAPNGEKAEVGIIGPFGIVGHALSVGASDAAGGQSLIVKSASGISVNAGALNDIAHCDQPLRAELDGYMLSRLEATEGLCACNALHSIGQRLARWLLQACDLIGTDAIGLTHRELSDILGVRRASVTTSLHLLEGSRAIECRRGCIVIRNRRKLVSLSCGCERLRVADRYPVSSSARSTEMPRS